MSETQSLKQQMLQMASSDVELLFAIIGDLSFVGYKIALCKLNGNSLQQCATKYRISKRSAQYFWEKCQEKKHDEDLRRLFNIKNPVN